MLASPLRARAVLTAACVLSVAACDKAAPAPTPETSAATATAAPADDAALPSLAEPTPSVTPPPSRADGASNGDGGAACGAKPLPDCPLQAWMKQHMKGEMRPGDLPEVARALDTVVTFAPKGYDNWASIARDGATAARGGDLDGTKASCRGCHQQYKSKYKAELRSRPL